MQRDLQRASRHAVIIAAATLASYLPALNGGFIWTDATLVTENAALGSLRGLLRIWVEPGATQQYYPLTYTVFWLEYQLAGLHPLAYHLVNVALHVLGALLLWRVLCRLAVPGAAVAALIFALHPVQVESVAWITELSNVLSGVFFFAALLAWLHHDPPAERPDRRSGAGGMYAAALLLFLLAVLSKSSAVTLPAVIAVLIWWKTGRLSRRDATGLAPMFLVAALSAVGTVWVEREFVGAHGAPWDLSLLERCLIAGRALWFYAGTLFWPHALAMTYPSWSVDTQDWLQYAYPAAATAVPVVLWALRRRIGRAPLAAVLIFAVTLSPVLGFFDIYYMRYSIYVADHWLYLGSSALIALAVGIASRLLDRGATTARPWGTAAAVVVAGLLAVLTWRQAGIYTDEETLWRENVARYPQAWVARNNLASVLIDRGAIGEALAQLRGAARMKPDWGPLHANLGELYLRVGDLSRAAAEYRTALRLDGEDPRIWARFGIVLAARGATRAALEAYREALRRDREDLVALNNLAWLLATSAQAAMRDGSEAVALAEKARSLYGPRPFILDTLAAAYAEAGRFTDAVRTANEALARAAEAGRAAQVEATRARLRLYRAGRPYREDDAAR